MTIFSDFCELLDKQPFTEKVDAVIVLRNHDLTQTKQRIDHALNIMLAGSADILLMSYDDNTYAEAVRFSDLTLLTGLNSIALVTHRYHHYRAYLTFLRVFSGQGVHIISAPVPGPKSYLIQEVEKIEKYLKKGHVSTLQEGINELSNSAQHNPAPVSSK